MRFPKGLLRNRLSKSSEIILCDNKSKNIGITATMAKLFSSLFRFKSGNKFGWLRYFLTIPKWPIHFKTIYKLIILTGLLTSFTSCEYYYNYSYTLTNQTDGEIEATVKSTIVDSIYYLKANEKIVLFVTEHGYEGSKGPYFSDVIMDLDVFIVKKEDTLNSSKVYLNNDSWIFYKGNYSATVTNEEF